MFASDALSIRNFKNPFRKTYKPLTSMKPMLKQALSAKFGIAAFNMTDYNSARAIIDGALELKSPVIIQLSVKTISLWGFVPIADWVRSLANSADIPMALHLDHCKDLSIIKGCIDAGWTSVMFDGSVLPFGENLAQTQKAYEMACSAGVGLEAEIGAIGGTEDDKFIAEDQAILANVDECIAFCQALPELAAFAPAIGTAHGVYNGEPKIAYDRLCEITAAIDIPIALHGGTGLAEEQFHRCIASGCSKVNISTMHKLQFINGPRRKVRVCMHGLGAKPNRHQPHQISLQVLTWTFLRRAQKLKF